MSYRKQYDKNRPQWTTNMLDNLPSSYLIDENNLLKHYTHYQEYSYFRNRIHKSIKTEEQILDKFESYYINRIDIRLKQEIGVKDPRNTLDYLKKIIRHIDNCIRGNGLYDRIIGSILSYEQGKKRKKWHIHMYLFWRGDMKEGDHDKCLVSLKRYIDNLCPDTDCWCVYDCDIGLGRIEKHLTYKRNKVRCLLSYLSKLHTPEIGLSLSSKIVEDWDLDDLWNIEEVIGDNLKLSWKMFSCRVRMKKLLPLSEIRDYPRLRGGERVIKNYRQAKIGLATLRRKKASMDKIKRYTKKDYFS